jgi:hypothetical protein
LPRLQLLACFCAFTLAGCATVRERIPFAGERQHACNEAYSLLYKLTVKESDVDKILILKHASPSITAEIKAIAETFRNAREQLEKFALQDRGLQLKATDLPVLEKETRDAIEKSTTERLFFSTGKNFERELLFTQLQSLDYGSHLAIVLRRQEGNKQRQAFLSSFSKKCERLREAGVRLLSAL